MEPRKQPFGRRTLVMGATLALLAVVLASAAIWRLQTPATVGQAAGANADLAPPSMTAAPKIVTPRAATPDGDTLQLVVGGVPRPFSSGESIPIAGDVSARVTVSAPDTTPYYRSVEVYLYHEGDSSPVSGADIQARVHMLYMDHGTAQPEVVKGDAGHYLVPVQFAMAGEWELDVTIATADTPGVFALSFGIYH